MTTTLKVRNYFIVEMVLYLILYSGQFIYALIFVQNMKNKQNESHKKVLIMYISLTAGYLLFFLVLSTVFICRLNKFNQSMI